jgi:hypothetical protein
VYLYTGYYLLGVPFITSLTSNSCTALTTPNTTENNCIILTGKKRHSSSAERIFKYIDDWSQQKDGQLSPVQKKMPRSTANFSVSIYTNPNPLIASSPVLIHHTKSATSPLFPLPTPTPTPPPAPPIIPSSLVCSAHLNFIRLFILSFLWLVFRRVRIIAKSNY